MNLNKIIQIKARDNHCLEAIYATPTIINGSGLIVLHEIFSLTSFTNVSGPDCIISSLRNSRKFTKHYDSNPPLLR
ncbi:Uncharacterised protein [Legionella busanensis]|uniref:Uncharacterized protein n=1 Tax=Legionella busanensis TaxID=190655 RepID=A0A378KCM8_9GAMM|nr:Uncharacterised protein [Legionella busanensis]